MLPVKGGRVVQSHSGRTPCGERFLSSSWKVIAVSAPCSGGRSDHCIVSAGERNRYHPVIIWRVPQVDIHCLCRALCV